MVPHAEHTSSRGKVSTATTPVWPQVQAIRSIMGVLPLDFGGGRKSPRRIPGAKFCARRGKPKAPRCAIILRSDVGGVEREQIVEDRGHETLKSVGGVDSIAGRRLGSGRGGAIMRAAHAEHKAGACYLSVGHRRPVDNRPVARPRRVARSTDDASGRFRRSGALNGSADGEATIWDRKVGCLARV